jgi:hypothetical protein
MGLFFVGLLLMRYTSFNARCSKLNIVHPSYCILFHQPVVYFFQTGYKLLLLERRKL